MNKAQALRKIDEGWLGLIEVVDKFDAATFDRPAKDGWSPKDHLSHLAAWEGFLLAILEKQDRFTSMGVEDMRLKETDEINDAVFHAHRGKSSAEVRAAAVEVHRKVRSAIEALSESDLHRRRADFQPKDIEADEPGEETVLDEIEWNTWGHYAKHIEWVAALVTKSSTTA